MQPDRSKVNDGEHVGRRLTGKREADVFVNTEGVRRVRVDVFVDSRGEPSVDRLGVGNINRKWRNGARACLKSHAEKNAQTVFGWVVGHTKLIRKYADVLPDPLENEKPPNPYHAIIDSQHYTDTRALRSLGVSLSSVMTKLELEPPARRDAPPKTLVGRLRKCVSSFLDLFRQ